MSRAAGQPFTRGDVIAIVSTLLVLVLVAVALTAMTNRTGVRHCDAATNPSTSAPVGGDCMPSGFAAH